MRIGFDAKRFFLNQTGLGNYSRDLVRGVLEEGKENDYFLYTPEGEIDLKTLRVNSRLFSNSENKSSVSIKSKK